MRVRNRSWSFLVLSMTMGAAGAFVFAACDDDTGTAPATPDGSTVTFDSSTTPPSGNDGQVPGEDAGADAEELGDGGGLPPEDDDGGLTDPDGGFDGGNLCAVLTTGAFINTTCSARVPIMTGGILTTTNYQLASVVVIGSASFCNNDRDAGFKEFQNRGALEVTADTATTGTFEFLDQYRRAGGPIVIRPTTVRYDVKVTAAGNGLVYQAQPCAIKTAPPSSTYSVGVVAGSNKKSITLRLPYGNGFALYRYVEP